MVFIKQERLSTKGRAAKVHNFRDATVDDMTHHVIPLLRKETSFFIIYVGTNDTPYSTSRKILDNLLSLKSFTTNNLPKCNIVISTPTLRTNNGKAVNKLNNHLLQLDIDIIDNRNINARNLSKKGLHLNPTSSSRLAKNLLSSIKSFWKVKGCPGIINDNNIEPGHSSVFCSAMPSSMNNNEDQLENRNLKGLTNIRLKNRNLPIIGKL